MPRRLTDRERAAPGHAAPGAPGAPATPGEEPGARDARPHDPLERGAGERAIGGAAMPSEMAHAFAPRRRTNAKQERTGRAEKPEPSATERALRLLSARARTAQELSRALARARVSPEESAAALARMRELGYIDDASLADSRARRLVAKGESPRLVARKLQQQGVAAESAQAAAKQAAEGATDDELAARALEKRLRGRPVRDERERRRLMRALVQHGHRPSSVARALKLEMDASGAGAESGEGDEVDDGNVE